jgi:hypothetical protein
MVESGLTVVLSPVQLAAAMSGQAISEGETAAKCVFGGLRMLAGTLEMVGARALVLVPEPTLATKAGGVVLAAHGADNTWAGFWQLWTGVPQRSLTEENAAKLDRTLGASPETAETIGTGVNIAVPLVLTLGLAGLGSPQSVAGASSPPSKRRHRAAAWVGTPFSNTWARPRRSSVRAY